MTKAGSLLSLLAIFLLTGQFASASSDYPSKPVDVIVPYPAGAGADLAGRVIAKALQEKWKSPVRVVNMPGGNAIPGLSEVLQARPDGHKLLLDMAPTTSLLSIVMPNLPYKATDRTFITLTNRTPNFLGVSAGLPFASMKELTAALKKDPASVTWGSLGGTGMPDVLFRQLFKDIGIDVSQTRPVSFKGTAAVVVAVAGGHVMMGSSSFGAWSPFVEGKKVRLLVAFAEKRSPFFPDVPSTVELGYPTATSSLWMGLSGPSGIPQPVVDKIHASVSEALSDPNVIKGLALGGNEPLSGDGARMRKLVEAEMKLYQDYFGPRTAK